MHDVLNGKKSIFFDVGYTLDYPASGDWMFTNRFLKYAGDRLKTISPERIRSAREKGLQYLTEAHLLHDIDEEQDRFRHYYAIISDALELGLSEQQCRNAAYDRACNMENYVIYPDAKKVLETLSTSFSLGIISDTWPSIGMQLGTLGIGHYFSFATYSYELGVFKPDERMYLDALSKCGCAPEETVFIDDVPRNLEGAARLGITPVLIAAEPASDIEVFCTKIHSLSELLQ
ncbi:MAG: HAD-IA family hydrolase [Clostridia bacterium]|nr:HAD-IA family hydrolase [Clostridia bacterium]